MAAVAIAVVFFTNSSGSDCETIALSFRPMWGCDYATAAGKSCDWSRCRESGFLVSNRLEVFSHFRVQSAEPVVHTALVWNELNYWGRSFGHPRYPIFSGRNHELVSYERRKCSNQTKLACFVHGLQIGLSCKNIGGLTEIIFVYQMPCSCFWNLSMIAGWAALETDTLKFCGMNRSIPHRRNLQPIAQSKKNPASNLVLQSTY